MAPVVPWVPRPYPPARRAEHTEEYQSAARGAVRVPDPYVWLEESTPETAAWVDAQEAFARAHLDQLPDRARLEDAIRANTDYARFSAPSLRGGHWYWYYNSGLQAQSSACPRSARSLVADAGWHTVMYRSSDSTLPTFSADTDNGPGGEVFFDVRPLSPSVPLPAHVPPIRLTSSRKTAPPRSPRLPFRVTGSTLRTVSRARCARLLLLLNA
jgi:prolyl oligopeptidase